MATSGARSLKRDRILYAPVGIDLPRLNGVEVPGNCPRFDKEVRFHLPEFCQFHHSRLLLSRFIRAARLQNRFLTIPVPAKSESHMGFRIYRTLNLGFAPCFSVVGGNFNGFDAASTGPR